MKSKTGFIVAIGVLVSILIGLTYYSTNKNSNKNSSKDDSRLIIGYIRLADEDLTDNTFEVDEVEWITSEDKKRIKELHLEDESFPDGYYIYDPITDTKTINVNEKTVYEFCDWEHLYLKDGGLLEYTTNNKSELINYLKTYKEGHIPPLFWIEIKDDVVVSIKEQPVF